MIGQVTPVQAVLVCSESMIIVADRFVCYPSGFEFHLALRTSRPFHGPPMPLGGPQVVRAGSTRGDTGDALRFGIAFADGRKATNLGPRPFGPGCGVGAAATAASGRQQGQAPPEPEAPLLTAHGGSGSDGRWDQSCWVWGLPPEGPMGVVVEWPAEGIEETRVDIDSALLREAASRAEIVWES